MRRVSSMMALVLEENVKINMVSFGSVQKQKQTLPITDAMHLCTLELLTDTQWSEQLI